MGTDGALKTRVPLRGADEAGGGGVDPEQVRSALGPWLADPAAPKICHNAKQEILLWRRHGVRLQGIVLDLMLPEVDGLEVCRRLRADRATAGLPILMLTAKADAVDRVVGLEVGADDDVVKPFSPRELVARVRAVLRRAQRVELDRPLVVGRLTLDPARRLVRLGDTPLHLTPREYELLETLVEAGGRVLTREQLLDRAWGYARAEEVETRTVDVHVRRLRAKLGEEGWRVLTVKGAGYRFEVE